VKQNKNKRNKSGFVKKTREKENGECEEIQNDREGG
jgi:hypothetical protein